MKMRTKGKFTYADLRWPTGSLPHLETWLKEREGSTEAVVSLDILIGTEGGGQSLERKVQALIDASLADMNKFLDREGSTVPYSPNEKRNESKQERNGENLDALGLAAGVDGAASTGTSPEDFYQF